MDRLEREAAIEAWSRPPVAGVNLSPLVPLGLTDPMFKTWLHRTRKAHWAQPRAAHIRKLLPTGGPKKRILDYGCGFGMDALEYIEAGHEVSIADINPLNLAVARRAANVIKPGALESMHVLNLDMGDPLMLSWGDPPGSASDRFDVITMNGVLHHAKDAAELIDHLRHLTDGFWFMVYTDKAWRDVTKSEPPEDPEAHPQFQQFVNAMDENGHWATFYTKQKLEALFSFSEEHWEKETWKVTSWTPVDPDGWFAVAEVIWGNHET